MPTIYPEETFDDEAEYTPHGSGSNRSHGQKSFSNPAPAGLERRHAAPGLTPTQWLAQWCRLEEQA